MLMCLVKTEDIVGDEESVRASMTPYERTQLHEAERLISRGIRSFLEVGRALAVIKEQRLYRSSHPSFSAYLKDRWGFNRAHGYRLLNSVQLLDELRPIAEQRGVPLPDNERQLRLLRKVKDPERCCDVLEKAHALAGGRGMQYRHVVDAIDQLGIEGVSRNDDGVNAGINGSDAVIGEILAKLTERFKTRGDCQREIELLQRLEKLVEFERFRRSTPGAAFRRPAIEVEGTHQSYVIRCRRVE